MMSTLSDLVPALVQSQRRASRSSSSAAARPPCAAAAPASPSRCRASTAVFAVRRGPTHLLPAGCTAACARTEPHRTQAAPAAVRIFLLGQLHCPLILTGSKFSCRSAAEHVAALLRMDNAGNMRRSQVDLASVLTRVAACAVRQTPRPVQTPTPNPKPVSVPTPQPQPSPQPTSTPTLTEPSPPPPASPSPPPPCACLRGLS